jgi:L-fuconolactonase
MENLMDRSEWLGRVYEAALEPEQAIIDPHHHFWQRPDHRFSAGELLAEIDSGHNVRATVYIECSSGYFSAGPEALRPVGETEYVMAEVTEAEKLQQGQEAPVNIAAGIVGFADLNLGDAVDQVLEAHLSAGGGRFRGIRHAASWDGSPDVRNGHTNPPWGLMADPVYRAGFARLAKHALSFEAWQYHTQIPEVTALAQAFPDTTIILNHFSGPLGIGPYVGQRAEIFEVWKRDIAELARCPNVVAKLGGMAMVINGFRWHKREMPLTSEEFAEAYGDWYRHAIDAFGPERCMFESNFPVDRVSISYGVLWNGFKRLAKGFSDSEKAALFHDTAARVYRLSQ